MEKLAFIGFGSMGRAIATGLVEGNAVAPENILAYAPHWEKLSLEAKAKGIRACRSAREAVDAADTVLLAVKPYQIEKVISELRDELKQKAVLSIALGYDYARLSALLDPSTRLQFIMPNTPAMVGSGVLLFEEKNSLRADERMEIMRCFGVLGIVEELPSHLMGIGGAISGCGPAFCAMIIEALADAGVKYGLSRATAYRLASKTLAGTGEMQIQTQKHPAIIKDEVCSPAGATICGVEALELSGLRAAMMNAIQAIMMR